MHQFRPTATVALLLALVAGACTSEPEIETAIDREAFIAAYVAVRTAIVEADGEQLSHAETDSILAELGVGPDDLLDFADVNAHRLEFMREIWNEVEAELDALRPDVEIR